MPTPAEQKALAFVALMVLLGGAVRVVRSGTLAPSQPSADEQQALARQTFAANSSATSRQTSGRSGRSGRGHQLTRAARDTGAKDNSTGASGVQRDWRGLPPPSPRIDIGPAPAPSLSAARVAAHRSAPPSAGPIDLDTATEAEIEALPRVGPALARRIVANRDSVGPFGGLEALRRVRGMGPATLKLVAPLVTFSGQARR